MVARVRFCFIEWTMVIFNTNLITSINRPYVYRTLASIGIKYPYIYIDGFLCSFFFSVSLVFLTSVPVYLDEKTRANDLVSSSSTSSPSVPTEKECIQ